MSVNPPSQQRRLLLLGCLCVCVLFRSPVLDALDALVGMTDSLSHPPPSSGTYAYNGFVPANTGGASYVDPVFGANVRRLTTDHQADDIYAHNSMWNADATKYLHGSKVVSTTTGQVTHTV